MSLYRANLLCCGQVAIDTDESFGRCGRVERLELVDQQRRWHKVVAPALHPALQFVASDIDPHKQDVPHMKLQAFTVLAA